MRQRAVLIAAAAVFFLSGCITRSIAPDYELKKGKESIVIGTIYYPETGIPHITKPMMGEGGTIEISTIIGNDKRVYSVHPEKSVNGWTFYITMPQGRFRVNTITWGEYKGDVNGIFTVYETGKIYYIGDIRLTRVERSVGRIVAESLIFGMGRYIPMTCALADGYRQSTAEFFKRYPGMPRNVEKSLIRFKDFDKD